MRHTGGQTADPHSEVLAKPSHAKLSNVHASLNVVLALWLEAASRRRLGTLGTKFFRTLACGYAAAARAAAFSRERCWRFPLGQP